MQTNLFTNARDDFFTRKGASDGPPPFFVGRTQELNAITTAAQTGKNLLFQGPRGIGKTYLIWHASILLRQGTNLTNNQKIIPIRSDEDFRDFHDLLHFILDVFLRFGQEIAQFDTRESQRIVGRGQREADAGAHRIFTEKVLTGEWNSEELTQRVVEDIRETLKRLKQQSILFLENLDDFVERILSNNTKEQKLFLDFLTQSGLTLIATTTTLSTDWNHSKNPFYQRFDIIPLQEFSVEEAKEMLIKLSESQHDTEFKSDINKRQNILETLYPFTDGNARNLAMFYTAVRGHKHSDIRQALSTLLATSTPYYQERFKKHGLSALRLKTLIHMVSIGCPTSQKAIANKLKESPSSVRSAIKWLADHHYVKPLDIKEKEQKYVIKDTLFRMWLEVRQTPDSLQRITSLISFFEAIHEGKETTREYEQGVDDISTWETTSKDHAILQERFHESWSKLPQELYHSAKSLYKSQDAEGIITLHENILKNRVLTQEESLKNFETLCAIFLFFLREFHDANVLFETLFQKHDINDELVWWVYSRSLLLAQERLDFIMGFNKKWREKFSKECLEATYHHGVLCLMKGDYHEAITNFDHCLTLKTNDWSVRKPVILANRGQALLLSGNIDLALKSCLEATQIQGGENIPQIHRNLVGIYLEKQDTAKAAHHLQRATQCIKEHPNSRNLDMNMRTLFQSISDDSPLVEDGIQLVEAFIQVTRHRLNRVRIQRLLNDLIGSGKLIIVGKIIQKIQSNPNKIGEMFQPYIHACTIFAMESIRDKNEYKKNLLPELREAVDIILQMMYTSQERLQ